MLASAFETAEEDLAAIEDAAASRAEADSFQTPAERFADVAEYAVAGRTAAMLDQLVDAGVLDEAHRVAIAADKNMTGLARILRRAEVAGHDPQHVLTEAITQRPLTGSRSLANVLRSRIDDTVSLEPVGGSYADWIPAVTDPAWRRHLEDLAAAAEERQQQLGETAAVQQPAWAVEALGPVPDDPDQRTDWTDKAGLVSAQRELAGIEDDTVALGAAPKPEQVEAYAGWRAAWRALGRPEAGRDETELSDGQLRLRIRAFAREQAWEPAYVAPELSGTAQAQARHQQTAQLRSAEANTATDPVERDRLLEEAAAAKALADTLAERAAQLAHADEVRGLWYAHTAETRAAAQRAEAELAARGINSDPPADTTTTREWLDAADSRDDQSAAVAAQEEHALPTDEAELAEVANERAEDAATFNDRAHESAEPTPQDIRVDAKPARHATEDWTRVPTAEETADTITRAQHALAELERRRIVDEQRAHDEARDADLNRWHTDDREAEEQARPRPEKCPPRSTDRPTCGSAAHPRPRVRRASRSVQLATAPGALKPPGGRSIGRRVDPPQHHPRVAAVACALRTHAVSGLLSLIRNAL